MKIRLKPLSQQVMIITGATSGIGLALARRASRRGAAVFLIARNSVQLERLTDEINGSGGNAAYTAADVGNDSQVRAAARYAIAHFGHFDTWVNVAGVAMYSDLMRISLPDHERVLRTNYWGVVNCSKVALQHFADRHAALITVGSIAGEIGSPVLGAYAASKHAAKGYVDSLRIEVLASRRPTSVTLIKPSGIGSPLAEYAGNDMGSAARIPPPAYDPELVVDAILHAATHPVRELTVGGAGALQLWAYKLFPNLSDRLAVHLPKLLSDPTRPANATNNLHESKARGEQTSIYEPILHHSAYSSARMHPLRTTVGLLCVLTAGWLLYRRFSPLRG
jgi:short-subunit dehydrogenase